MHEAIDYRTLLQRAAELEIQAQEDRMCLDILNQTLWLTCDKYKGNILRFKRPFAHKRLLFTWFSLWATTRSKPNVQFD